jgi:hypothetical protein
MHLPDLKNDNSVTKLKFKEKPIGIHPRAQLPIFVHIKTDCMGVEYPHDPSN